MNSPVRSSISSNAVSSLLELVFSEGTSSHRYCGPAALGDSQSFVRDLVDFADFVHLVTLLHGQVPCLIDHAATHVVEVPARQWLLRALDGFANEREFLNRLCVAAGPLPSTSGHSETSTVVAQQRHAIAMLARSDRRGCALGTAIAMVLDWEAIRAILDAGAIRLGIEPPARRLPSQAETAALIAALPDPERLSRALNFGASQLLGQHRGLWDLLEARAQVRRLD
jgi:hypothetical protein